MDKSKKKVMDLKRRHKRLRNKISGTASCPRMVVSRSLRNISVQIVDDVAGKTLASSTSNSKGFDKNGGNIEGAKAVGELIAKAAKEKDITNVVFDRGGRKYHGRVKALADAAREGGLKF